MTARPPPPPRSEAALRDHARAILLAGVEAADPEELVAGALESALEETGDGSGDGPGRVILLAGGKAALAMARGARRVLGDAIAGGVIVGPPGSEDPDLSGLRFFQGGHPLPTQEGAKGTRALVEAARGAQPDDRILLLLSGGGSAILTLPADGLALDDLRTTTRLLLESGTPIGDFNAVRKHLDVVKGGGLARAAGDTPLRALVLSDVVGDRLDVIASGPVSPDSSTWSDAVRICRARDIWDVLPAAARERLERGARDEIPDTPASHDDPAFRHVTVEIVGNARTAAEAASAEAEDRGYHARLESTTVEGEAREVGRELAGVARRIRDQGEPLPAPAAVVSAGETTVTVTGEGRGGRNQEVALGAALALEGLEGALVASLGTDGVDGPTDAAGALATGSTVERARTGGLEPRDHLARNDAYPLFDALGDLLVTGPTGTNVMDLQVVLVAGEREG